MKQKWTVDYRNWIGTSDRGLLFVRARLGSGKWRKGSEIPAYVAQYLHLDKLGRQWVLSGITEKVMEEGGNVDFAKRTAGRFYCYIEPPKVEPKEQSYAPLSVCHALHEFDSPWQVYRVYYKYTDCGPSLGFRLLYPDGTKGEVYCDGLPGSWEAWRFAGIRILGINVSSIVEGVDQECETIEVPCSPLATLKDRLDEAVTAVNLEAADIWNQTHGCKRCGPENEWGYRTINPKCKACKGEGVIL